ncbi:bestrophin family protein [Granulicella sp. L60]|uniref:bestrophin family protein n=1 Tax=Granulicella sp. L60 TaxID=1641866 RepID=UPI00131BFEB5|nr:bestrophin family protein [Granulicella sp. L60]
MIVRDKPTFWELIGMWRLSILRRIAPQIASILLWSCLVVWLNNSYATTLRAWTVAPFTLLGVALSIFLGFRNSACYDRWWEARRQLGAMVGEMRSFARICVSFPKIDQSDREALVRDAITYAYELMYSLRDGSRPTALPAEMQTTHNPPDFVLRSLGLRVAARLDQGVIGEQVYKLLEEKLTAFAAFQVACERIRSTPTPFTYTLLIHRTSYAYCFLLPFGLASTMGWATPLFTCLVAYAFFGLDALGDELEDPFGDHANALPLLALARTIEISLLESINAKEVPDFLQPVDFVLT